MIFANYHGLHWITAKPLLTLCVHAMTLFINPTVELKSNQALIGFSSSPMESLQQHPLKLNHSLE